MNRRSFLSGLAATSLTRLRADAPAKIQVRVNTESTGPAIPADFLGFGYEISSVAAPGVLSPKNKKYIELVRSLSREGVIRIGGNTSDFSSWSPDGKAVSLPKATVTNKAAIDDLGGFVRAIGWKLIWGLNVGTGTPESAADQAAAVAKAAGDRLLCFELGNEPDLFVRSGHRPEGYGYKQYLDDYRRFAEVLHKRLPGAPLAGPDIAGQPDWVTSFAADEGKNVRLLTEHYYLNGQKNPSATLENLLKTDERFVRMTARLQADSKAAGVPYRLVELNSFSGGGRPGVSDTFASALWGLDLMFTLASNGGAGINFETGINHLGFVSSYSPIADNAPRPLYYAMLAFHRACGGRMIEVSSDAAGINFKAWAFRNQAGQIWAVLINKDLSSDAEVQIAPKEIWRLTAPAVSSTTNVAFARAALQSPAVALPRASAAFVRL